jgi:asparagine synthase (glutamine-hydrolysing)
MADRLVHRGPNGVKTWQDSSVGLGHCMLWTTPESVRERLPLVRGPLAITADARIDNRDVLISTLGCTASEPDMISDSELILGAYERWGESCVEHLVGDFAFAIWDASRQRLFCARDHMGVKPFYYYTSDRLFAFASEVKALLSISEVRRTVNELRVGYYLADILDDRTLTFFEHILRLPAAHTLTVSPDSASMRAYWSLDSSAEIHFESDAEYAAAFRKHFTEAVRCRLRSVFPIGADLSGGLDSSSVVSVARDLLRKQHKLPLSTFSLSFEATPECDERTYQDAVVANGEIDPHYIPTAALNVLDNGQTTDQRFDDEVMYGPHLFLTSARFKAVRHAGIRVVLSGVDGDTAVSHGHGQLTEYARRGQWKAFVRNARGYTKVYDSCSLLDLLRSYVIGPLVPHVARSAWQFVWPRSRMSCDGTSFINTRFAQRINLLEHIHTRRRNGGPPLKTERAQHYDDLTSGVIQYNFEEEDRLAAAFGLECRYPFFDKRLVEFCLALPPEQKMRDGWTRVVLRHAMEGVLPPAIQWRRSKTNLTPSFFQNLSSHDAPRIDTFLKNPSPAIEEYVDLHALRRAFKRYTVRPTWGDWRALYVSATLASWLDNQDVIDTRQAG